jgi:uncharacterized protein (TIGR03118 family)
MSLTYHRAKADLTPAVEPLEPRCLMSASAMGFSVTNLVSDLPGAAKFTDPDLVNPWGVSFGPGKEFWISDNGTGKSTLYLGDGTKQSLVVDIPGVGGSAGTPSGQVFNGNGKFNVEENGKVGSSIFIFVAEDGTISGWDPKVDATHAIMAVNHSTTSVFKGAALGQAGPNEELFVTNFRAGTVDIFAANFSQVHIPGAFVDPRVPKGYAPFNIQNLGGDLYVTYAKQDAEKHDDVAGAGNGFVDEFDTRGHLVRRLQHGDWLNSPWGLTLAPATFGKFAGDLLVGNFGSGQIDAYSVATGKFAGSLDGPNGQPIHESGLWDITPGSGGPTESIDTLFFTAGLNQESDGLFGTIEAMVSKPSGS